MQAQDMAADTAAEVVEIVTAAIDKYLAGENYEVRAFGIATGVVADAPSVTLAAAASCLGVLTWSASVLLTPRSLQ